MSVYPEQRAAEHGRSKRGRAAGYRYGRAREVVSNGCLKGLERESRRGSSQVTNEVNVSAVRHTSWKAARPEQCTKYVASKFGLK